MRTLKIKQVVEIDENIINKNYRYYILLLAIRDFLSLSVKKLKIVNQKNKNIKEFQVHNELLDAGFEWHNIINGLFDYIETKYPKLNNEIDFIITDKNENWSG